MSARSLVAIYQSWHGNSPMPLSIVNIVKKIWESSQLSDIVNDLTSQNCHICPKKIIFPCQNYKVCPHCKHLNEMSDIFSNHQKLSEVVKVARNCWSCQNFSKLPEIVKIARNCQSCQKLLKLSKKKAGKQTWSRKTEPISILTPSAELIRARPLKSWNDAKFVGFLSFKFICRSNLKNSHKHHLSSKYL